IGTGVIFTSTTLMRSIDASMALSAFTIRSKSKSRDRRRRESLAQYILRSPFSLEKITYQQQTKPVLYRSKMNPVLKKNFAVFPVLDWDWNPHHAYPQQRGATDPLLRPART